MLEKYCILILFTSLILFLKIIIKKVYFLLEAIKDEEDTQKIFDCLSQAHVKYEDILMFCYGFHCELPLEKQRSLEQKFSHYLAILQQNKMAAIYESLPKI